MMPDPILELYVKALDKEREARRTQPVRLPQRPMWTQWLARALVRAAVGVSGAQVRIEWPAQTQEAAR